MLQEMRMVLRARRVPGMDDPGLKNSTPTMDQVLTMATVGGARTTAWGDQLGTPEVGTAADLILLDWQEISHPYLDEETPVLDAVIQRARTAGVRRIMCAGETIHADGRSTRVDQAAALQALHDELAHALLDDEVQRRHLSKALLPHIKRFHAGHMDPVGRQPFYRPSSTV